MSNIGFLENLIKKYQPELLGADGTQATALPAIRPTDQPVPFVGDAPVQPGKYDTLISAIDQLPAVGVQDQPQTQMPQIAPVASTEPAMPAIAPRPRMADVPPPPIAAESSTLPAITPSEQRLNDINAKTYNKGVYRNPQTGETTNNPNKPGFTETVTAPGNSRDKKWSTWDKVGSFLQAWAKGGLIPGIAAATDRNYFEKQKDNADRAELLPIISGERQRQMQDVQIQNTNEDNRRARQQADDLASYRKAQIDEAGQRRMSNDKNTRMRTVASMLSKIPNYDPNDPRFASVTKALGDVNLPIAPKDAKKKIQLVQDADSGAWTLTLTDPYSGQQEVRPVTSKDGSQLVTTSSSKVAANAAAGRQEDQQQFTLQRDQIAQKLKKELDDHKAAIDEIAATNDQSRKLELVKANEERQKRIAQLQNDLRTSLGDQ